MDHLSLHCQNVKLLEISCTGSISILTPLQSSFISCDSTTNQLTFQYDLGLVARKPVFGVSVKARLKPVSPAT